MHDPSVLKFVQGLENIARYPRSTGLLYTCGVSQFPRRSSQTCPRRNRDEHPSLNLKFRGA